MHTELKPLPTSGNMSGLFTANCLTFQSSTSDFMNIESGRSNMTNYDELPLIAQHNDSYEADIANKLT
jgi:hypothetical protein